MCDWLGGGRCPEVGWFAWLNDNCLDVLAALMDAVPAGELDTENVCTVNTCLVALLLARRNGALAACLRALSSRTRQPGDPRPGPCAGFEATLRVWARSYFSECAARDKDRRSLERASGIAFAEFKSLVNVLLGPPTSPVALRHYSPQ